MNNVLMREPLFALSLLPQLLKLVSLPWRPEELTSLLTSDAPEPENSSPQKKTAFHVSVKKSRKEDGNGLNAHQSFEEVRRLILPSDFIEPLF